MWFRKAYSHRRPSLAWTLVLAVPFYFLWNHLAPTYAYGLPPVYQHLPFWDCVGLFAILGILRYVVLPL